MDREIKKITSIKVNHSYITDCVNDARMRRQCHGSVVQSYFLGESATKAGNKQVILNVAITSNSD